MTFAEGSTLIGAFTTGWSSLFSHHPKLQPGNTVLCLGTGGVSLCAAQVRSSLSGGCLAEFQLALVSGARIILTSSSQAKLDRAKTLLRPLVRDSGTTETIRTIDYSKIEKWDEEVRRLTAGKGVDIVIEIAGRGTIARSIRSTRRGGLVAVSGE